MHAAAVLPRVAKVKGERERVAQGDSPGDPDRRVVLDDLVALERVGVDEPDPPPVSELELVQMRQIPAREPQIDRRREPQERERRADDEDPTRYGINRAPLPAKKINPNLKPRLRNHNWTLRERS